MIRVVLERNDSEKKPTKVLFLDKSNDRFLVEYNWHNCDNDRIVIRFGVSKWENGWRKVWEENWDRKNLNLKNKAVKIVKMFSKDYDYDNWGVGRKVCPRVWQPVPRRCRFGCWFVCH